MVHFDDKYNWILSFKYLMYLIYYQEAMQPLQLCFGTFVICFISDLTNDENRFSFQKQDFKMQMFCEGKNFDYLTDDCITRI